MTARQHPIGSDMGRGPSGEAVEELPILQGLDPLASLPPHRRVALTHTQIRRASNAGSQFTSICCGEKLVAIGAVPSFGTDTEFYDISLAATGERAD